MAAPTIPTGNGRRLDGPLGGPHLLFDGSFMLEMLQPPNNLNASVLMKATYVGGHHLLQLGKSHPQAPPLHIHFSQSESFIVTSGAIGTTTTYATVDTIHTPDGNHSQATTEAKKPKGPPLASRSSRGVSQIPPHTPHNFWP